MALVVAAVSAVLIAFTTTHIAVAYTSDMQPLEEDPELDERHPMNWLGVFPVYALVLLVGTFFGRRARRECDQRYTLALAETIAESLRRGPDFTALSEMTVYVAVSGTFAASTRNFRSISTPTVRLLE